MEINGIESTSDPNYFFRRATNKDAKEVKEIIFNALESYGLSLDPADTDKDLYDIEKYYPQGYFWVILDKNGNICGSFALYHIDKITAEIRKMYFHPSVRGKGLGTWGMDFLLQKAKEAGYRILTLETASVLKEAISLYRKFGFKTSCGELHSYRCDVKMERILE